MLLFCSPSRCCPIRSRRSSFWCIENFLRDWRHRPEFVLSVPTLVRSIADTLCNFIFLFEDLPARAERFMASGYREAAEMLERAKRDYPSSPDWRKYVADSEERLRALGHQIGKPAEELLATNYWPTPPQMKVQTILLPHQTFSIPGRLVLSITLLRIASEFARSYYNRSASCVVHSPRRA